MGIHTKPRKAFFASWTHKLPPTVSVVCFPSSLDKLQPLWRPGVLELENSHSGNPFAFRKKNIVAISQMRSEKIQSCAFCSSKEKQILTWETHVLKLFFEDIDIAHLSWKRALTARHPKRKPDRSSPNQLGRPVKLVSGRAIARSLKQRTSYKCWMSFFASCNAQIWE